MSEPVVDEAGYAMHVHSLLPRMMPYLSDAVLSLPCQQDVVITLPMPQLTLRDCLDDDGSVPRQRTREVRSAVFFAKTVERCHDGLPYDSDLIAFAKAINYLVAEGALKYGHLAPPLCIPLADISSRPPSAMILFYSYSDLTREQLNERYKVTAFVAEGELPTSWEWAKIGGGQVA